MMVEVAKNLFVGDKDACTEAALPDSGLITVHAAKTCHARLLGYPANKAAPKGPEYLIANRPGNLYLNLVDSDKPEYIPHEVILDAVERLNAEHFVSGRKVLVHCDSGFSRSPSIAFLYLASKTKLGQFDDWTHAADLFRENYPYFQPQNGMKGYIRRHWDEYRKS
jgi:predicted protein tyrosine phosphatase